MTCTRPIHGFRVPGGGTITTNRSRGWCDRPVTVPCGVCPGCRVDKAQEWSLRCVHEASLHEENCFVTLTYADEHLPAWGGLDHQDWQKFAKRLRKSGRFRFFMVGEYGDTNYRPHFHACIFGRDFSSDRYVWTMRKGHRYYRSDTLEEAWKKGFVEITDLNFTTAGYAARYSLKKIDANRSVAHARIDRETGMVIDVRPPYMVSSCGRRKDGDGGIGYRWLEKFKGDVFPSDFLTHRGKKYPVPRYYDEQLSEEELEELRGRRQQKISGREADYTWERLKDREVVLNSRLDFLKRRI